MNYIPSYCFNWSDPHEIAGHKQSGDIDNPNNFENHKAASTDIATKPLDIRCLCELSDVYGKYYDWFKLNLDKLNIEYYERYAKQYITN